MRIACLAWGSLIWKPGDLSLLTAWRPGGPPLPIEFSRVGDHHELSTVLCPGADNVPTKWNEFRGVDLASAIEQLREREEIDPSRPEGVGCVSGLQDGSPAFRPAGAFCGQDIAAWGTQAGVDAVIWTALPPRFEGEEGRTPSAGEAVTYLRGLGGEALEHARHYVKSVPADIRTPVRAVLEQALGWHPDGDGHK